MCWVDPRRIATRSSRLVGLFLVALLAAPLSSHRLARAASFDLSVCDPDPLLNGAALLAALTTAAGNGASDTITLGACAYLLNAVNNTADGPNGLPSLGPDGGTAITIAGAGAATLIERAGGAPAFRLFHLQSGAALELRDLTLRNGLAQGANGAGGSEPDPGGDGRGGAAFSLGALMLTGVALDGNRALGGAGGDNSDGSGGSGAEGGVGQGGAVYSAGALTVSGGTLSNNQAAGGAGGAGSDDTEGIGGGTGGAGGVGQGGAIYSAGDAALSVSGATFSANVAQGGAGGASGAGPFGTGGVGGEGGAGQGGAVFYAAAATLPLSNLTFQDQQAVGGAGGQASFGFDGGAGGAGGAAEGGAVFSDQAGLSASGVLTLRNNRALGGDGGPAGNGDGGVGGQGGDAGVGYGGALLVLSGGVDLSGAAVPLITQNQARGGAGGSGGLPSGPGGRGGAVEGGAIFSQSAVTLPGDSTVSDNQAQGGAGGGAADATGGPGGVAEGGAIFTYGGAGAVSIAAGSQVTGNRAEGGAGAPQGLGGVSRGGAIFTASSFSLSGVTIANNSAQGGSGGAEASGGNGQGGAVYLIGAISNSGSAAGSQFNGNTARGGAGGLDAKGGDGQGGAICYASSSGSLSLGGAGVFTSNSVQGGAGAGVGAGGAGQGGAVYLLSAFDINNQAFSDNTAAGGAGSAGAGGSAQGGALYSGVALAGSLAASSFGGNSAEAGQGARAGVPSPALAQGGALFNAALLTLDGGSFQGNQAVGGAAVTGDNQEGGNGQGGAIYSASGASLTSSGATLFDSNSATGGRAGDRVEVTADFSYGNRGGRGQGGAIFAEGGLALGGATLRGNRAVGGQSGDISGSATFLYAWSGGDGIGGAVYLASGAGSLTGVQAQSNAAAGGAGGTSPRGTAGAGGGEGGAVYNLGDLTVSGGGFSGNSTPAGGNGGGAISSRDGSALRISGAAFDGNSAPDGYGGGAVLGFNSTLVAVSGSTFSNNSATTGGALATVSDGGDVTVQIQTSAFTNNTATNYEGGAAALFATSVEISDSTFSANRTLAADSDGGAIISQASLSAVNTTIDGNSATGSGGGLRLRGGEAELDHLTITGNTADSDADGRGDGGGIDAVDFGGLTMANSIVALNSDATPSADGTAAPDLAGSFGGDGYNLIGDGAGAAGAGPTDLVGTPAAPIDPLLGALANNGGPTQTRAPLGGSPAVNAGDPAFAPPPDNDQRGAGFARISNGRTDIGAVEVQLAADAPVYASSPVAPGPLVLTGLVGTPVDGAIAVSNVGAPGSLLNVTAASPSAGFVVTTALPSAVVPGDASQSIGVRCTPSASGTFSGTLTVTTNEPDAPTYTYTLVCRPLAPGARLAPSPLDFGSQRVGAASPVQRATLSNTGSYTLTVSGVAAGGDFALAPPASGDCPAAPPSFTLAPGASCTIPLVFTPTAPGARSGVLSVTDDAGGSPRTAALSGTGVAPAVTLAPSPLDFGNQTVGVASGPRGVTLTNSGSATLTVSGVTVSGDFALVGGGAGACPATPPSFTLEPGVACVIALSFTPAISGTRSGALSVADDADGSPHTVALSGIGVTQPVPGASLTPLLVDFGTVQTGGSSGPQQITISSTGTAPLIVSTVSISGADFVLAPAAGGGACPTAPPSFTLDPGATCTLSVLFRPATGGRRSGAVSVATNIGGAPLAVSLTGLAVLPVSANDVFLPIALKSGQADLAVTSLLIAPGKTSFSAGEPVTVSVTVTNQGSAPTTSGFWVDLYINPARPPTVNTLWSAVCGIEPCVGVAWPVTAALAPGQSVTLTTTRASYDPLRTFWTGWLSSGTARIYALADSWNTVGGTGAVPESDEANNLALIDGLSVTGPNPPYQPWPNRLDPAAPHAGLPERPLR